MPTFMFVMADVKKNGTWAILLGKAGNNIWFKRRELRIHISVSNSICRNATIGKVWLTEYIGGSASGLETPQRLSLQDSRWRDRSVVRI